MFLYVIIPSNETGEKCCRYIGVDENGMANVDMNISRRCVVHFDWHISVHGYDEHHGVSLMCGHACARGVSFPESWRTGLRCIGLGQKAEAAAQGLRGRSNIRDVQCVLLGHPRPAPLPAPEVTGVPGAVVQLQTGVGMRQDYLLLAHIEEDRWICHKGVLDSDGALDVSDPFAVGGLVEKDILRDAFEPDFAPRRRVGRHTTGSELLEAANAHQHSWRRAVAVATWRAETLRSRSFDFEAATAGYEPNPFRWRVAQGWLSHARVALDGGGGAARSGTTKRPMSSSIILPALLALGILPCRSG